MTTTVVPEPVADPAPGPRGRRGLMLAAVLVLVLAAATSTVTVWVRHYSAAPPLEVSSGAYLWRDTAGAPVKDVSVGTFDAVVTEPRPHHTQSFEVWVHNPASVTQTIVGPADPGNGTAETHRVLISTTDPSRPSASDDLPVRPTPVAVPPHGYRVLRYLLRSGRCWQAGYSETFTQVDLRVRVGAFTRTEVVDFSRGTAFVLAATHRTC